MLYFPIIVLIIYSFNTSKFSLQWQGLTFHWYVELFHDHHLWEALIHSIILGLIASTIATTLSLFGCLNLFLFYKKRQASLDVMLLLLIIIPDLVLGVALLLLFKVAQIPLGFFSLLIAHITFCIPFASLTLNSRIKTLDSNIYFSALDLGASHILALTKVILPLLWPAMLGAFLLSFTLSFDDVMVSYFVAGPDFTILPLAIYSLVRAGVTPELNALCTLTLIISVGMVFIAYKLSGKAR